MNKKLIRLTESDLHRIVKESVNKVLTELDWKTYANAAGKARGRGDKERAYNFGNAAIDNFNKNYKYYKYSDDSDPDFPDAPSYSSEHLDYAMDDLTGDGSISSHADQGWSYGEDWGDDFTGKYGFSPDGITSHETRDPDGRELDPWLNTAKNVGNKEIEDYVTNKYDYQKGLGWRKK